MFTGMWIQSGGPFESTEFRHLLLWGAIVGAFSGFKACLLRAVQGQWLWPKICVILGPLLIPLFWLHGVLFDVPNNYATASKHGFLKFWLTPSDELPEHLKFVLGLGIPAVFLLVLCLIALPRLTKRDAKATQAALALTCWYFCAALLHHIPDLTEDQEEHGGTAQP